VIAELREVNARLVAANAALATRVGELERRLGKDSSSSSRTPSSDGLGRSSVGRRGRRGGGRAGLPIQWLEPFGLVMIEAMACGTPVLAWRNGSVPEVVEDGVTGFVRASTKSCPGRSTGSASWTRGGCAPGRGAVLGIGRSPFAETSPPAWSCTIPPIPRGPRRTSRKLREL